MNLKGIRWESVDWINLAQDGQNWWAVFKGILILLGCIKFWEFLDWLLKDDTMHEFSLSGTECVILFS
jgi:hypothetical protein